ncbi:hypothetical protein LOK85_12320 [Xylella fastidiosa subsp. multiplex]|uniref:hypothetical protein n=1 Tax=Xylella fastidiosa TaxID=2371 RepID=UPI00234C1754|nr:hypothetical protein [Xylella fastidiosa]MDC6416657.1 hypothetical protein [Xylella fastidiosa subsp. multiplex]
MFEDLTDEPATLAVERHDVPEALYLTTDTANAVRIASTTANGSWCLLIAGSSGKAPTGRMVRMRRAC